MSAKCYDTDVINSESPPPPSPKRPTKKRIKELAEKPDEVEQERPAKRVKSTKSTVEYKPEDFSTRIDSPWKVGPHVSAAGGIENTIINAASIGANAFALFVKSQRKWASSPLTEHSISTFKTRLKEFNYDVNHILPHGSYLVNLGNPDEAKREKSYQCFLDDLKRCELLGLKLYNFHPGSTVGQATPEESLSFIAECINRAHKATDDITIVLENMAGSGNVLGSTFAQLGTVIVQVNDKSRVGVCLDTCHMFAAVSHSPFILNSCSYGTRAMTYELKKVGMTVFDREVGLKYLRGMHLNDSKSELNSKKDRHENIGLGHLKLSTFSHILTDPRTQNIPLILETPAFDGPGGTLAEGMDIWKKEIEVLNKISLSTITSSSKTELNEGELETWQDEIEKVVNRVSAEKDAKTKKATSRRSGRKGTRKRGSNKVKEDVDDSEDDETGSCHHDDS
ncbi:xylose isomerase-like protein [Abortiporus biennis]|nr:xylose isomerase-like protein [Abortiporus biennis]